MLSTCVHDNVHFECLSSLHNQLSDVAKSDEPDCAALDSSAVCEQSFVPFLFAEKLYSFRNATIDREDQSKGQLCHCVRVLAWAVCNVDTLLSAVGNIDCVVTGTCAHNKLQLGVGVYICLGDLGGSDDQDSRLEFT